MSPSAEPEVARPGTSAFSVLAVVLAGFIGARLGVVIGISAVVLVAAVGALAGKETMQLRPVLLVAIVVATSWRADAVLDGLMIPETQTTAVVVRLLDDPRSTETGWRTRVEVIDGSLSGTRLLASGRFSAAPELRTAMAGDRLDLRATITGAPPGNDWEISHRLVGRIEILEVDQRESAGSIRGVANRFRQLLRDGAQNLDADQRALFDGLTVGDDRGQSVIARDNFRASGLGHLLAVSGQNVVFVLIVLSPLISRIPAPAARFGATLLALAFFGFVTRFEPSVLRAIVMVGLVTLGSSIGRPVFAADTLPAAVVGLAVIDPLLAWSVGFQLSVAATLGLVILTPLLGAHVLVEGGAIGDVARATLAAQLAVSPLLIVYFDSVPVVAVLTNVLATPAAGAMMMWGLTAGTISGLAGGAVAEVLHLPTRALLWWIDGVAALGARLPVSPLRASTLVVLIAGLFVALTGSLLASRRHAFTARRIGLGIVGLVVAATVLVPASPPDGATRLESGLGLVRRDGTDVVILSAPVRTEQALAALRESRLGRIDLLIVDGRTRSLGRIVAVLDERFPITEIWAPTGHEIPRARAVDNFIGRVGEVQIRVSEPASPVVQ